VKRSRIRNRQVENGSILGVAAIGMLSFLLIAGLAIDISNMYVVGSELQNAADAAALAGASALNSNSGGITEAVNRAVVTMNNYKMNKVGITLARSDVRFAVNLSAFDGGGNGLSEADAAASPTNIRFVRVTIPPKAVNVYFATIASIGSTVDLSRKAVAGQSVAINNFCSLVPMSVAIDETGAPLNPEAGCPSQTVLTAGCTYPIRLSSQGQGNGAISPGNYLLLAFPGDSGGSDLRQRLALGTGECYIAGSCVSTEPGTTAGPVRQGMNVRFNIYQGGNLNAATYPPDTNIKQGITYAQYASGLSQHQLAPSNPGVPNRRILLIPIIRENEYGNGRDTVCFDRVGAFFMRDQVPNGNGGVIRAEYIGDRVTLGNGGFNPGGAAGNPQLTVAVLYK
jgi:hypothetical protein